MQSKVYEKKTTYIYIIGSTGPYDLYILLYFIKSVILQIQTPDR